MSLVRSALLPVIDESCLAFDIPKQQFLLGPAPFVVKDEAAETEDQIFDDPRPLSLLPVPHRYSA